MYAANHTLPIKDMKIIKTLFKLKFLHHIEFNLQSLTSQNAAFSTFTHTIGMDIIDLKINLVLSELTSNLFFTHMNLFHGISNHKGWVTITCLFANGFSLIPLDISKIIFLLKGFVRGSTRFRFDFT